MKKRILVFLVVISLILLPGCKFIEGTPLEGIVDKIADFFARDASPEQVKEITGFLNALKAKEYDKAEGFIYEDSREFYNAEYFQNTAFPIKSFKVTKQKKASDIAKYVYVTIKPDKHMVFTMKQVGKKNEWKITSVQDDPNATVD